jgi:SAM-dependent methyltransferase
MSENVKWEPRRLTENQLQEIKDEVLPRVKRQVETWLEGVTRSAAWQAASTHLALEHVQEKMTVIERYLPDFISPHSRILEIGTGFGAFITYTRALYSWNVSGCEPDSVAIACSLELAKVLGIQKLPIVHGVGEALTFSDATFDLVYSSNVLEHVTDPEKVLAEALRVLRPGGYLFFTFPNYGSWWEGHYGIPWIPNMPKWAAKIYVQLYKRDPKYLDGLHLLTVPRIKRLLKPWKNQITVTTFGQDLWQERMTTLEFGEWGYTSKIKRMLRIMHRLPFLIRPAILMGNLFHWYYPIILVLRKDQ